MIQFQRLGIVIAPTETEFKTVAKYNAGMVLEGGVVHMLYRHSVWRPGFDPQRQSNYITDRMCYARLTPEGKLVADTGRVVLAPSQPWDAAGCQDARIVAFEGYFYLTYCGWDKGFVPPGKDTARVCIARTRDFVTVEKLGYIPLDSWDKDAFLFPERIGGKIALVHRVEPNIQIDYFDRFEDMLDPASWLGYAQRIEKSNVLRAAFPWECGKVGGSVPPIRTSRGWLIIYHAVEQLSPTPGDFIYRAGAALLDLANPSRVTHRIPYPILEPREDYELSGDVPRVVFPVGGYVHQQDLYISYGGADRVVAMAKIRLEELLEELEKYPA